MPDDLATARMCSPYWGSRDLTAAKGLCEHLPRTLRALVAGVISPYQARLVAEGTTCVDPEHRAHTPPPNAASLTGAPTPTHVAASTDTKDHLRSTGRTHPQKVSA